MLVTQKIKKIKKKVDKFFNSLMLSKVKFNDFEAISRELMVLITS